jgi:predicted aspartyl protease
MGTFFHSIRLIGPSGTTETLEALVDTGAMFTTIPAPILERLGVRAFRTMPVRFANGQIDEWRLGQVDAELVGVRMPILCLFGSSDAPPLIGAHALEAFLLTVDPAEEKLVPKEAYLMQAIAAGCKYDNTV